MADDLNQVPQASPDQAQPAQPSPDQQPQPVADSGTNVPDQGAAGTADLESRVPGASGTADLERHIAPNVIARAAQGAQQTKTGLFKHILLGALEGMGKGLVLHGVPGAIEGAISPDTTKQEFSNVQTEQNAAAQQAKANVALSIAEAHRAQAMAENYPEELRAQKIEHNQTMAMGLKAYGVNPIGVVEDPNGASAMAHQLMNEGRTPMVMEISQGQYAVYDWNQFVGSPLGLEDANLYQAFNGGQQLQPEQWSNPKFANLRSQIGKASQQFLHPSPTNLMQADQLISKYQGIVKGIDAGMYANLPGSAKTRMIQTLGEMVEAHNQYLSEMEKLRTAPANARYFQVNLSDGTVTAMTGPQLQAKSGQAQANNQANNPNAITPTAVNSKANDMLQATDQTGREVAGTPSELSALGLNPTSATKMASNEAFAVRAARQLIQPSGLFGSIATQIKALGPDKINLVGSRINDFLLGKVGTGPEYVQLRNNLNLLTTRLQQVHVGNRPSDKLFEHFKSMWDAGKMDYPTLNSALHAGYEYAVDRAMLPSKPKQQQAQAQQQPQQPQQ